MFRGSSGLWIELKKKSMVVIFRAVRTTSFLSDGFRVVSGSDDLTCRLWDVVSAAELNSFTEHTDYIRTTVPSKLNPELFVTGDCTVCATDITLIAFWLKDLTLMPADRWSS